MMCCELRKTNEKRKRSFQNLEEPKSYTAEKKKWEQKRKRFQGNVVENKGH